MTAYTSNTALLTVLPAAGVEGTGWTVQFLSDIDQQTVWGHTADFTEAMFSDELSDVGGFTLTMRADDPLWERPLPGGVTGSILDREVVVRFLEDGATRFEGFLADVIPVEVDEGPRVVALTGPGMADALARGIMLPADLDDPFAFIGWDRTYSGYGMAAWHAYLAEAQWRGACLQVGVDFTPSVDSRGVPWMVSAERTFTGGIDLLKLLNQICDADWLSWRLLHGYRTLQVADEIGSHLEDKVIFFIGRHLTRSEVRASRRDIVTDVYVQGTGITHGFAGSAAARAKWGRRERWLVTSTAKTQGAASIMGAAELALRSDEQISRSIQVVGDAPGRVPFDDYRVGDWVGVETIDGSIASERVVALSVRIDATGAASTEITLQSKFDIEEVRTRKALARLGEKSLPSTGEALSGDQAAAARIQTLSTRGLTDVSTTAPTNGQTLLWNDALGIYVPSAVPAELPAQTGNGGKFLTTDGSAVSWGTPAGGGGAAWPPDEVPGAPSAYDYEFAGSGSSLPSGWSWANQGSATYTEQYGSGYLTIPVGGGDSANRLIQRPISADATWTVTAKFRRVALANTNFAWFGLHLYDSASTRMWGWMRDMRNMSVKNWNNPNSWASESFYDFIAGGDTLYLRIRKNSSTSFDLLASTDGAVWQKVVNAHNPSGWIASPTHFGWFAGTHGTSNPGGTIACEWWRYVPSAI